MSNLWDSLKKVPNGEYQMKFYYDKKSLYEIRAKYADWIESLLKDITIINEDSSKQFCTSLSDLIKATSNTQQQFSLTSNPIKWISPENLLIHFTHGIAMEFALIEEMLHSNQMNQNEFIERIINSCLEFDHNPNNYLGAVYRLTNILQEYNIQKIFVFNELNNWKRKQIDICSMDNDEKKKANTEQSDKLNKIQNNFELLSRATIGMSQIINLLKKQYEAVPSNELYQLDLTIIAQQENLIKNSLIVEIQPNQVIKTNTSIPCSVRWLLGPELGFANTDNLTVECVVVSETEANNINRDPQNAADITVTTDMRENVAKFEYKQEDRVYSSNFKNLQIYKIQRLGRRGSSDSVMDEKSALLFRVQPNINDHRYVISALSLPVVVIVHGNQDLQAVATIMWDNAFSEFERDLFHVTDKVSWTKLADALYLKCFSETTRGFTDANRNYLCE